MKFSRNLELGMGLALATIGFSTSSTMAEGKYAPLVDALVEKKQEALLNAEEAQLLAEGYQEFLEDSDTDALDRPGLRKSLLQERTRYKLERAQAARLQVAQRNISRVPEDRHVTLPALKSAYQDLDVLGARGKAAWDQVLSDRATFLETLEADYRERLDESQVALSDLNTTERANQILLDAINTDRAGSTRVEFFVALKLPSIKSTVELGFGITDKPKDLNRQAQASLIALIGYSQFFWDHYSDARTLLTEDELPSDRKRNIFGVPNGAILTSEAISHNQSHYYYLSNVAKERFNDKLHAIWGNDTLTVNTWNQKYSDRFSRACHALATTTEDALLPNQQVFELLEQIETLIAEQEQATDLIEEMRSNYQNQLAEAKQFSDEALLSSASYNAELWARESKELISSFEAAEKLLAKELTACSEEDWKPKARGITASSQNIEKAQKRLYAVRKVKLELSTLLDGTGPGAQSEPLPLLLDPLLAP